jgi:hypothetical protein
MQQAIVEWSMLQLCSVRFHPYIWIRTLFLNGKECSQQEFIDGTLNTKENLQENMK